MSKSSVLNCGELIYSQLFSKYFLGNFSKGQLIIYPKKDMYGGVIVLTNWLSTIYKNKKMMLFLNICYSQNAVKCPW